MKNNFLIIGITSLMLLWSAGVKALDIVVTGHTEGNLATEISDQLEDGQTVTDITSLTISGGNLNLNNDAVAIKSCTNLETLDVSGITFASNATPGNVSTGLANGLKQLKTAFLPNSLITLHNAAFSGCSALETVKIKSTEGTENLFFSNANTTLTTINDYAFNSCTKLQANILPPNVSTIRQSAFNGSSISITELPVKLTIITGSVFRQCTGITELTIPASESENVNIRIDKQAFFLSPGTRIYTIRGKSPMLGTTTSNAYISPFAFSVNDNNNHDTPLGSGTQILRILKKYASEYTRWAADPSTDAATTGFGMTIEYLTQTLSVTISGGQYGTIAYSGDGLVSAVANDATEVEAYEGEAVTLTFTPQSGSELTVSIDGGDAFTPEDNTYTIENVSQTGHTIDVSFSEPPKAVWTGDGDSNDWNDEDNWEGGVVPNEDIDIYIPAITDEEDAVPAIPDETSVKSITFAQGAQVNLAGSLTVNEAVHVKYTVEPNKWYSIGFPFEEGENREITVRSEWFERQGWAPLLPYTGTDYGDGYYGDYWLRLYDPEEGENGAFAATGTIAPQKGYIIQFPEYFNTEEAADGNVITFTFSESQTLSSGGELPVTDALSLEANPSLKNFSLSSSGSNHYYYLEGNEYKLLKNDDEATLKPFEAAITILRSQPETLLQSISVNNTVTGIGNRPGISNDPLTTARYYTLQGIETARPIENGIYIVKQYYQSGREKVEKIIYKQK
jgi:hypothetical protein